MRIIFGLKKYNPNSPFPSADWSLQNLLISLASPFLDSNTFVDSNTFF